MEKVLLSVVAALFLGGLVVVGVQVQRSSQMHVSRLEVSSGFERVRASLADIEEGIEALGERIRAVEERQVELETEVNRLDARAPVRAVALEGEAKEQAAALLGQPDRLKEYVFAAIAEERELREKEREKEREEMRQRMEERRKEFEALSQGPYERYNLKVNSMAKVLHLTESQTQSYYELTEQYSEKLEQARREARDRFLAAARQGQGGGGETSKEQVPGGEGGRNRRRPDFGAFGEMGAQMRQVSEAIQKEYAEQVLGLLTVSQTNVYNQLPEQMRSLQYLGMVTPPGEEPAMPFFRGFEGQGGMRGAPANMGAGRAGRGGRGGR